MMKKSPMSNHNASRTHDPVSSSTFFATAVTTPNDDDDGGSSQRKQKKKDITAKKTNPFPFSLCKEKMTRHLYDPSDLRSAHQKSIRKGDIHDAVFTTAELDVSGFGNAALTNLQLYVLEDHASRPQVLAPLLILDARWHAILASQSMKGTSESARVQKAREVLMAATVMVGSQPTSRLPAVASPATLGLCLREIMAAVSATGKPIAELRRAALISLPWCSRDGLTTSAYDAKRQLSSEMWFALFVFLVQDVRRRWDAVDMRMRSVARRESGGDDCDRDRDGGAGIAEGKASPDIDEELYRSESALLACVSAIVAMEIYEKRKLVKQQSRGSNRFREVVKKHRALAAAGALKQLAANRAPPKKSGDTGSPPAPSESILVNMLLYLWEQQVRSSSGCKTPTMAARGEEGGLCETLACMMELLARGTVSPRLVAVAAVLYFVRANVMSWGWSDVARGRDALASGTTGADGAVAASESIAALTATGAVRDIHVQNILSLLPADAQVVIDDMYDEKADLRDPAVVSHKRRVSLEKYMDKHTKRGRGQNTRSRIDNYLKKRKLLSVFQAAWSEAEFHKSHGPGKVVAADIMDFHRNHLATAGDKKCIGSSVERQEDGSVWEFVPLTDRYQEASLSAYLSHERAFGTAKAKSNEMAQLHLREVLLSSSSVFSEWTQRQQSDVDEQEVFVAATGDDAGEQQQQRQQVVATKKRPRISGGTSRHDGGNDDATVSACIEQFCVSPKRQKKKQAGSEEEDRGCAAEECEQQQEDPEQEEAAEVQAIFHGERPVMRQPLEYFQSLPLAQLPTGRAKKFVHVSPQYIFKGPFDVSKEEQSVMLRRLKLREHLLKELLGSCESASDTILPIRWSAVTQQLSSADDESAQQQHSERSKLVYLTYENIGGHRATAERIAASTTTGSVKFLPGRELRVVNMAEIGVRRAADAAKQGTVTREMLEIMMSRYVLGIGDSHLSNILMASNGSMKNIDYEENRRNVPLRVKGQLCDLLFAKPPARRVRELLGVCVRRERAVLRLWLEGVLEKLSTWSRGSVAVDDGTECAERGGGGDDSSEEGVAAIGLYDRALRKWGIRVGGDDAPEVKTMQDRVCALLSFL